MSVLHPKPGPHPVHTVHRVSAAIIGGFLTLFGALGLLHGLPFFATDGTLVLGLSSNGLLAAVSIVVGAVLLGSAARGGHLASTISIVLGGLFILSGIVNGIVLGTALNVFAFQLSNILFSLVVGAVLLITGAYGRITGALPVDNPYHRERSEQPPAPPEDPAEKARDLAAGIELAEAERAYALHYATPEQLRRLEIVRRYRSTEDRHRAWLASGDQSAGQPGGTVKNS